ncbi:hypothetical protein Rcae01_04554 [Novipirellula caenicola]|uniref:Uncharacterized protein n=1 Tax=Novipirellula caenicola TaxID=1536901 RepID=A0ABP9VVC6_9BACT
MPIACIDVGYTESASGWLRFDSGGLSKIGSITDDGRGLLGTSHGVIETISQRTRKDRGAISDVDAKLSCAKFSCNVDV